jgi:Carboxylesterase family
LREQNWFAGLAHKGVMAVTIAYRLGPLGFLAHPGLRGESSHHTSGNYGLMDQIAALEWIQENRVWRRWQERNDCRAIFRSDFGEHPDGLAAGERIVSARDRRKRRAI